jgi:hypothetical protein
MPVGHSPSNRRKSRSSRLKVLDVLPLAVVGYYKLLLLAWPVQRVWMSQVQQRGCFFIFQLLGAAHMLQYLNEFHVDRRRM